MTGTWTREDEISFIKDISQGLSIEQLTSNYNKNVFALDLKLKKIIHENIQAGISMDVITKALNLSQEKVLEHDANYVQYEKLSKNIIGNQQSEEHKVLEGGGESLASRMNKKMKQLNEENQILKTIIENKELHKKLNKLIKSGSIDANVKLLLKQLKN